MLSIMAGMAQKNIFCRDTELRSSPTSAVACAWLVFAGDHTVCAVFPVSCRQARDALHHGRYGQRGQLCFVIEAARRRHWHGGRPAAKSSWPRSCAGACAWLVLTGDDISRCFSLLWLQCSRCSASWSVSTTRAVRSLVVLFDNGMCRAGLLVTLHPALCSLDCRPSSSTTVQVHG